MADTLTTTTTVSTIPSGTVIATDDAGAAGHVQVVKLAVATDGSATAIPADSNGLKVNAPASDTLLTQIEANTLSTFDALTSLNSAIAQDDAGFPEAISYVLMTGGRFDDTTPDSVDEGDGGYLRMSANRNLYTTLRDAAGNERGANIDASNRLQVLDGNSAAALTALQLIDDTVATDGSATPTKGILIAGQDGTNAQSIKTDASGELQVDVLTIPAVTNAGTFAVQVDGAALTALQLIDDTILADDAGFTPATSKVGMIGLQADETGTDSVDEGDGGAPRMTLDRKQIVTPQPHTQGGLTTFMASGSDGSSILVATAQAIKASAGQMYGYYAYNPEAAVTFVHFYNTAAASVTVGTTNPMFTIAIPAGSAANLMFPYGVVFSNAGWSCAATTTAGGNTAPATGVSLVVWYM
jgi:hypothetical protein